MRNINIHIVGDGRDYTAFCDCSSFSLMCGCGREEKNRLNNSCPFLFARFSVIFQFFFQRL